MSKWVCSRWNTEPKDSEKWEVRHEIANYWAVKNRLDCGTDVWLPKSNYVECAAPERWVDVTDKLSITDGNWPKLGNDSYSNGILKNDCYILWKATCYAKDYRLRKELLYKAKPDSLQNCEQWAFIVEKREDV